MIKKYLLILVLIAILILGFQYRNARLKSQLLEEKIPEKAAQVSTPCDLLSEDVSNTCLKNLAIEKTDANFCELISKPSLRNDCRREVELASFL